MPPHVNVNYMSSILHKESKSLTYPLAPSFVVQYLVKQCNVFCLGHPVLSVRWRTISHSLNRSFNLLQNTAKIIIQQQKKKKKMQPKVSLSPLSLTLKL